MTCEVKRNGWQVIERKLREKGYSRMEIEEARRSFYGGIEVLYGKVRIKRNLRENKQ